MWMRVVERLCDALNAGTHHSYINSLFQLCICYRGFEKSTRCIQLSNYSSSHIYVSLRSRDSIQTCSPLTGIGMTAWIQLPRGSSARCLRAWPCWHHYPCSARHMLSGWPWCGGPEKDRVPENIPIEIQIFNQQATYLSWLKFFDEGNGRNNQFSSWGSLTLPALVFCLSKLAQGFTTMCFHWSSCLRRESDWC